jgi:YegS/Rv2252/BmrU family lipid kinase
MQAAAILGLGCSTEDLKPFQTDGSVEWRVGMPASGDQADVILLFGGDGTVHRHLGQLVKLGMPVLVVPAGSGNDFAHSLNLRGVSDSREAWKKFCGGTGSVTQIDVGVISSLEREASQAARYFCCVAGVGLDGEVARRANHLPRWLRGHGGYVLSTLPAIFSFGAFPLKVSIPSEKGSWTARSDAPTLLAAFANAPLYGGGMKIAPQAKMDDGLLDVCILGAVDAFKLLFLFPTVYAGKHLGIREVSYFQAERARVESEQPLDVYADGEYVCRTPVEISIERAALRVVTL